MEASQQPEPEPAPRIKRLADHVFLDPEVVEIHLQNNEPIAREKARIIWLMNHGMNDIDPETTNGGW